MSVPEKLIRVSRSSIFSKVFEVSEDDILAKFNGPELDAAIAMLPTDEEREFMTIYKSDAPQLSRLQRKMSVCLDAEVLELEEGKIVFEYGGKRFSVSAPKNAFRICSALDTSSLEGFSELCAQGCVSVNDQSITDVKRDMSLGVDELKLLVKITEKFFFLTYLE